MTLAHIRSGAIVKEYGGATGWVVLEDGRMVSPPVEGFEDGNDKIVPVVTETVDNSTGPETRRETSQVIEAARVLRTITIRDATAQEIDNVKTQEANSIQDVLLKVITNHENRIRALEGRPEVTEEQVKTFLKGMI